MAELVEKEIARHLLAPSGHPRVRAVNLKLVLRMGSVRPTSSFKVRRFALHDLDQIVALEKVCFPERPYTRDVFLLLFAQAGDGLLVAEDGGRVLGYAASMADREEGLVVSIAVSPHSRRKGIGDALMESALHHLVRCRRIWLLVSQRNVAAISLYRKHSFRETGQIVKGYYPNGDDAVEMSRLQIYPESQRWSSKG